MRYVRVCKGEEERETEREEERETEREKEREIEREVCVRCMFYCACVPYTNVLMFYGT